MGLPLSVQKHKAVNFSYQYNGELNVMRKENNLETVFVCFCLGIAKLGYMFTLTSVYLPLSSILVANLTTVYVWLFALLKRMQ